MFDAVGGADAIKRVGTRGLVLEAFDVDPAGGAVNRGKAVLPMVLIRHLGQILDVHMDAAGIIHLDGLHRHLGAGLPGHQRLEVRHVGAVRGIFHPLALAPFRNRVTVEVVSLGLYNSKRIVCNWMLWWVIDISCGLSRGGNEAWGTRPVLGRDPSEAPG